MGDAGLTAYTATLAALTASLPSRMTAVAGQSRRPTARGFTDQAGTAATRREG